MIPTSILRIWFLGLLSWLFIGLAIYLGHEWYRQAWSYDFARETSYFDPRLGLNYLTLLLVITLGLILWIVGGRLIVRGVLSLFTSRKASAQRLTLEIPQRAKTELSRPDGSTIYVESYGPETAPVIVLTHGWGADRTEWDQMKNRLAERFRVITWDLLGLGQSRQPTNRDFNLEKLARDLDAVTKLAGPRPIVLLGHSIGGMIVLTFSRLFPQALGSRIAGLALVQTSYTNPVRTTSFAGLLTALERPFLIPLLHLTVGIAPVVWVMNWLGCLFSMPGSRAGDEFGRVFARRHRSSNRLRGGLRSRGDRANNHRRAAEFPRRQQIRARLERRRFRLRRPDTCATRRKIRMSIMTKDIHVSELAELQSIVSQRRPNLTSAF
jgi:pimeloyl-ACP methyl ester carboxylesterase